MFDTPESGTAIAISLLSLFVLMLKEVVPAFTKWLKARAETRARIETVRADHVIRRQELGTEAQEFLYEVASDHFKKNQEEIERLRNQSADDELVILELKNQKTALEAERDTLKLRAIELETEKDAAEKRAAELTIKLANILSANKNQEG